MNIFYSAVNNAFYPEELKPDYEAHGSWPADGVAVDESVYIEFAANEAPAGKMRIAGADNLPAWGDIPPPTPEQIALTNRYVSERKMRACVQAAFPLNAAVARGVATDEQKERLAAWQQYAIELGAVDLSAAAPEWPAVPA